MSPTIFFHMSTSMKQDTKRPCWVIHWSEGRANCPILMNALWWGIPKICLWQFLERQERWSIGERIGFGVNMTDVYKISTSTQKFRMFCMASLTNEKNKNPITYQDFYLTFLWFVRRLCHQFNKLIGHLKYITLLKKQCRAHLLKEITPTPRTQLAIWEWWKYFGS